MGKLAPKELETVIRRIRRGSSVLVPPKVGFDSGVHRLADDLCVVASTDPCVGVPKAWFGWLLVHYVASDVAVFGVRPRYCTLNLLGPPGTPTQVFQNVMRDACEAADRLQMQIVTGHTGRYASLRDLVGVCTAYGIGPCKDVITPRGVEPGDSILCTKPLGLETLVTFSHVRRSLAKKIFGASQATLLGRRFRFQSCVREALALSKVSGVHAMHDVAEGGLVTALNEIAQASRKGFLVDFTKILIPGQIHALARQFQLSVDELISMSSTGTLIAAVDQGRERAILRRLSQLNVPARLVGTFTKSKRRTLRHGLRERPFPTKAHDLFSKICL